MPRTISPIPIQSDPYGPNGKNYINVKTDASGGTGGITLLDSAVSNAGSGNFQAHTVGYWETTIWTHEGVVFQVDSIYRLVSMWFTYTPFNPHPGEQVPYSVTPPPGSDA